MPRTGGEDRLRQEHEALGREIGRREQRKLRSRSEPRNPWLGLRMFGMVGWSVTVPTLLGLAAGVYLDGRAAAGPGLGGGPSWTLTLLIVGVVAGCLNAWFWVAREGGLHAKGDQRPAEPGGEGEQRDG